MAGLFDDVLQPQAKPASSGVFDDVLQTDAVVAPKPKTRNPLEGARAGVYDLVAGLARSVAGVTGDAGEFVQSTIPLPKRIVGDTPMLDLATFLESKAEEVGFEQSISRERANRGLYEPITDLADFGRKARDVAQFSGSTAISSLPQMAGAILAPLALVASRSERIAEERARNDGRSEVTMEDRANALPAAMLEVYGERFGSKFIPGLGGSRLTGGVAERALKQTGIQTGTEAVQGAGAYLGETVGTLAGTDPTELRDAAVLEALGGLGVAAPAAVLEALTGQPATPTPPPVQPVAAPRQGEPAPAVGPTADQDALLDALLAPLAEAAATAPPQPGAAPAPAQAAVEPEALAEIVAAAAEALPPAPAPVVPPAPPPVEQALVEAAAPRPEGGEPASWIVRNKETGEVVMETFDRAKVDALNTTKYEAVPALQHLQEVNTEGTAAYANARREEPATQAEPAPEPAIDDAPDPPLNIRYGKPRTPPGRARPAVAPEAVAEPETAATPEPAPTEIPRERLAREPQVRASDLRREVGWSQRGGLMVRGARPDSELNPEQRLGLTDEGVGPVTGRTKWVGWPDPTGEESMFWRQRPDKNLTEKQANTAFDKYERGENLRPIEQRFIDYAEGTARDYDRALQDLADAEQGYTAVERQEGQRAMREQLDFDIAEADQSEALGLYELSRRAAEAGLDEIDIAPFSTESQREYAARLWRMIQEANRGTDTRAAQEDRRPGDTGRQGGPQRVPAGFALEGQAAAEPARQEVAPDAGLFGEPTTQDMTDDARRRRDAERDGRTAAGRTDMAAGEGELFAGPRPEQGTVPEGEGLEQTTRGPARQSFAEGSTPEMRALSQRAGAAEAESRGLKAAVDAVLGKAAVGVVYLRGLDGLPPKQKAAAERRQQERGGGKTSGIFDPGTNTVYLFTDAMRSPKDAAWTALHEIAGHKGLRAFLGADLDSALELALQNPTVKRLADAIAAERKIDTTTQRGRLLAAEEALAELAAAVRTGDYAHIKARYNVDVPEGIRARVKAAVDNFVRRLRALIERVLDAPGFSDQDVRALLENAWQAVDGDVAAEAGADSDSILESTEYTPEQQEAMKKAGVGTQVVGTVEAAHQAVQDKLRGIADLKGTEASRRVAIADRFHALKLHERIGTQAEDSSYIAARMSTGLPSVMEAMMLHGAPVVLGGKLDIIPGSKGLIESLEPVRGELNDWLGWMVGRRAQLLMGQGRENNLSKDDITALVALADGREDRFKAAAIDYLQLKKAALDVGEAWGTIDPVVRVAWDHAEYIPFLRERDDGGITAPRGGPGLAGQDAGIRRLRGGKAALADPLSNIVQNLTHLMDSALKNHAALMAVDQIGAPIFTRVGMDVKQVTVPLAQVKKHLLDNGVEQAVIDNMPDEALKGVARMLSLTAPTEPDVVRVMRDGKPEFYKVADPLVLRAMQGLSNTGKSTARRAMIYMRHLLTAGATGTPEFVIANTIRDTGSTWLFTDDPARHLGDAAKGLMQTLVRDKTTQRMMMAGASFIGGHYYDGDPKLVAKHMRRALRAKGLHGNALEDHIKTIAGTPAALFHGWNRLLSATETANRRAIYEAGLREGKSDLQAMFESKDVLDFSMRGDSEFVRFFTDVVPFLNARIQGVYKIGREMQPDKKRNAIIARGAVMAAVSTALALWNLEEHEEEYDKLPEWEKDVYWHIGPGTEYHIRIPKPFELGILFGTVPERIVRRAMGNDQNRESARAMRRAIMDTLQINPIPQALLPPTEAYFNYSLFTERPIEGKRDERRNAEKRYEWYTSDTMRAVSQAMADNLPRDWVMSPKKLEHLWRGYTAGVGGYILRMSDWMVRESTGAPKRPAMSLRDWPGVGRFVRGDAPNLSTRSTEEFYELFDTAQGMETAYKSSMAEGDVEDAAEILEDFGWLLGEKVESKRAQGGFVFGHVREMRRVRDRMSDDRKAVEAIAKSTDLTPEQKRDRIHEIQRKRNDDVHEYVETLRERRAGGTGEERPAPTGLRQASVPEERRAEYAGIGKGGTATTAPAVLKGARNAPKMVMVGDWSGLPESVRDSFDRGATGVYDPAEKRAYVVMGLPEAEAKYVAYHEIAGHHGLQGALGGDYEAVLNRARQNPTVAKLADAMRDSVYAESFGQRNRLAMTEEALSELAAARRTGDFDRIEQTWGVRIPPASRPGVKGMVERVAQLTRRKLADLTGDEPEAYNDEQVYSLIEDAWQYVKRPPNED